MSITVFVNDVYIPLAFVLASQIRIEAIATISGNFGVIIQTVNIRSTTY